MKLILNGGGDGNLVTSARQKLNELIDHTKKCLYVPLAWPDKSFDGCLEFITNELKDVDIPGIDMIKSGEELYNKNFNDYSFIYIGGGNTFSLLKDLKDSGSFEKIKEYLKNNDIPCDAFNENIDFMMHKYGHMRKVYFNILLDDKAGLGQAYRILKTFLDWVREETK